MKNPFFAIPTIQLGGFETERAPAREERPGWERQRAQAAWSGKTGSFAAEGESPSFRIVKLKLQPRGRMKKALV
ncbi:MAG: hypothetical protein VZQ99_12000, partial [Treponema sp.]|nr:hypothetical protein [Treponema sp.]